MDIISLIISILLGISITAVVVLLFIAIIFNMKRGRKYRQALAKQVAQLRLNKMLLALGIDTNAYLHHENIAEIHKHMERCEACENTEECDEALATETVEPDSIGFCNNEQSLQKIATGQSAEK